MTFYSFALSRLARSTSLVKSSFSTANKTYLVVNALGEDRLGIVSEMTKLVNDVNGSVGESQATKLGSSFSLTMVVSVPSSDIDSLKSSLKGLKGMKTQYVESSENSKAAAGSRPAVGYSGRFNLSGADHPGLVTAVTSLLANRGLSIDTMETQEEAAPHGGTTLFNIDGIATASYPLGNGFDADKIRTELEKLGESLNCDITLTDNVTRKSRLSTTIWENMA